MWKQCCESASKQCQSEYDPIQSFTEVGKVGIHQWLMCQDFKYFGQHIEIFMKKEKIYMFRIDTDPDPAK